VSFAECFPLEARNIADGWEKELTARHGVASLATLSESDFELFRYTSNIHTTAPAYQLLLAKFYEKSGMHFALRMGPGLASPVVVKEEEE
jgi:hypothetical protein